MPLRRRSMIHYGLSLAGTVYVSTALSGCATGGGEDVPGDAAFTHGVASGDPETGAIMLWTRAVPPGGGSVRVLWELAADPSFDQPLRRGLVQTGSERDFTIKVDVRDLQPGDTYYYRFRSADHVSPVGRTRTLPEGAVEELRLAVFSCSNYPAGYFHAYAEAARLEHIDAFVHLGDYFYEYGAGGYATERAEELGRSLPGDNDGELFTLSDYRKRYALYRSDDALQAVHARAPMIAVWDDHEIANDTWKNGAENHGPDEGDFSHRRAAAVRAYFEWMPLRPVVPDAEGRIYRSFRYGDLVDLHMLDTRLVGRDRQLEYGDFFDAESGAMDSERFLGEISAPERSMLGGAQRDWLYGSLEASDAQWQVLGQQVLMARMTMPAALLSSLFSDRDFSRTEPLVQRLVSDKAALLRGEEIDSERRAVLEQVLPYNLDAWDGYPVERERLYAVARRLDKKFIVLAGDTHNAWFSELRDRRGAKLGVELGVSGVTSPGMESYLNLTDAGAEELGKALTVLIDELQYCDLYRRGFMEVTFTREVAKVRWHFISDVQQKRYAVDVNEVEVRI